MAGRYRVVRLMSLLLATGGSGQLAQALRRARPGQVQVAGRPEFDFEQPESLAAIVLRATPALVINAAAYTAVDAAEADPTAAARANATGPGRIAEACAALGIAMIHISTDYVFDGEKGAPYTEADPTNPTGVYGATKLEGERAVLAAHPGAVILRTSWVYARHGRNFVITMLRAGKRAPRLRVVSDQVGCPTNADDLAAAVLGVADRLLRAGKEHDLGGIYHAAGSGHTSWHGLANTIFQHARGFGWPQPPIEAIATAAWPTPARRPADSRLDCRRLQETFGVRLPDWQASLGPAVAAICASEAEALTPVAG
jgi:dTDP-4-dehydrorhamnose reductase